MNFRAYVDLVRRLVPLVASRYPEVPLQARVLAMTDDKIDIKTFSLQEMAAMVLPPDMTNGARWLSHRLNRGELSGYRLARTWRMTHADVEDLIERHRNRPVPRIDVRAPQTDVLVWPNVDFAPTARARRIARWSKKRLR